VKNIKYEQSLFQLFELAIKRKANNYALSYKHGGKWINISWIELSKLVNNISCFLLNNGIKYKDRIAILSNSRYEWVVSDLAILSVGACTVPIYSTTSREDTLYILRDANVKLIFLENKSQLDKVKNFFSNSDILKVIVCFNELSNKYFNNHIFSFCNIAYNNNMIKNKSVICKSNDIATIIYTSGTTGMPKGVMLSHKNLIYEALVIDELKLFVSNDVQLLFLPLAHVFAKLLEVAWLNTMHHLVFVEHIDKLMSNMSEINPTFMAGVPRVYEKIYDNIIMKATRSSILMKYIFKWITANINNIDRTNNIVVKYIIWPLIKLIVFKKIQIKLYMLFGNRLRFFISGGAALSKEIIKFFQYAGVVICEGYGLTETSAATTINLPNNMKAGTVGKVVPNTQLKINDDGEILINGPGVFVGYINNKIYTDSVLKNGWFYSGDIGKIDKDGYLSILGRKKDIIITSGGKNIAPQKIENLVKIKSNLINQVVVHGDKRKFISALVTINEDYLKIKLGIKRIVDYNDLYNSDIVYNLVKADIDKVNSYLSSYEKIKKYKILYGLFKVGEELTPTLKIRRMFIYKKYKILFDKFYIDK